jgi:Domain of unknown function (DUF5615)
VALARLYFDHNVSRNVAPGLWSAGHTVRVTRGPVAAQLSDDAHLLNAVQDGRTLVTHDRNDFSLLHDAWLTWPATFDMAPPPHPGILVLDQALPALLAQVLAEFLEQTPSARFANAVFWWRRHDGWRQPLVGAGWERYQRSGDATEE